MDAMVIGSQHCSSTQHFMRHIDVLLYSVLVFVLGGCVDAPRDNPLDPSSPFFHNAVSVSGQVTVAVLNTTIPSAIVKCLEQGTSVMTDSAGNYVFAQLPAGPLTIVATKSGFVSDTQHVQLDPGGSVRLSFALNGPPIVLTESIITHKYDQYFPSPLYTVDVMANLTDPNGVTQVDSVWFFVDSLQYPLFFSSTSHVFETTLSKYDFPSNTINWLIGKPLQIRSKDVFGAVGISMPFYVTRIIENTATPASPISGNGDTTNSTPLFQWTPPGVTFNYTYMVQCSQVDAGTETLVWSLGNISSTTLQQRLPGDGSGFVLVPGNYVWSITIVDNFGNTSRSKEAAFVVQ